MNTTIPTNETCSLRRLTQMGVAAIVLVSATCANAAPPCELQTGDPIEKVKEQFGIKVDPQKFDSTGAGGAKFSYRMRDEGIWIFFDGQQRITNMRFEKPFTGKIGGVAIGDTREDVERVRGPSRQVQDPTLGMPDEEQLLARKQRKLDLIERLPDPAPKRDVLKAFEDIANIDNEPLPRMTGLFYSLVPSGYMRFNLGSASGRVQLIFSSTCRATV